MRRCCLCNKKYVKESQNRVFFKFPKDERRRRQWVKACGLKFTSNSFICQDHFQPTDYYSTGGTTKLMPSAVPSLQSVVPKTVMTINSCSTQKMDLNYNSIIKQEFPNSGVNLLQPLPDTDFNIPVKSEPITDDVPSLVTIKNEPIYDDPPFTQTFSTLNTERNTSQTSIVTTPMTIPFTTGNNQNLSTFSTLEYSTITTDPLQTPMIPGDSFVVYELETPTKVQQILGNNQHMPQEIPQIIPSINAGCNTQYNKVMKGTVPQTITQYNSTVINTSNSNTTKTVSSAPAPVVLNAKLRKRNKMVIPVNPIDKRTRYNIEGTTAVSLNKSAVNNSPKTLNANAANKKIINHLIKRKNVPKQTEELASTNSNSTLPQTENSEVLKHLTVKEERLSPNVEQIISNSSQTETHLKDSLTSSTENIFKPIILPKIQPQTETNLKDSLTAPSSDNTFKPIILPQIEKTSNKSPATIENLDPKTVTLNSDSPLLLESKEIKVPTLASSTELRVKCLCSLTANHSTSSEKDNAELKSFFNEMFEETRRLSKKQQRKIKMSLLQAISDAEDLMEQGKCCGF